MIRTLLDRAIYSYADVDRLTGLHPGTARRWLEGYTRGDVCYEPVLRSTPLGADKVTWGELVEARLLSQFRDRRVPLQRMRPAIERLRGKFGQYPLASAQPWLDVTNRELVYLAQKDVGLAGELHMVVLRNGQYVLSERTERFREAIEYDDSQAIRIRPDRRTESVVMDPERAFGQPAVRSVRTESLAEDYRAGTSREQLADLYQLNLEQVDDAIRFELIASSQQVA